MTGLARPIHRVLAFPHVTHYLPLNILTTRKCPLHNLSAPGPPHRSVPTSSIDQEDVTVQENEALRKLVWRKRARADYHFAVRHGAVGA